MTVEFSRDAVSQYGPILFFLLLAKLQKLQRIIARTTSASKILHLPRLCFAKSDHFERQAGKKGKEIPDKTCQTENDDESVGRGASNHEGQGTTFLFGFFPALEFPLGLLRFLLLSNHRFTQVVAQPAKAIRKVGSSNISARTAFLHGRCSQTSLRGDGQGL